MRKESSSSRVRQNSPGSGHLFSRDEALEAELVKRGKLSDLAVRRTLTDYGHFIEDATQNEPKGLGHAVFQGRDLIENKSFAVILPDNYFYSGAQKGCTARMAETHRKTGTNIMWAIEVPANEIHRYGIIQGERDTDGSVTMSGIKEKP